jgi:hypothetical protein
VSGLHLADLAGHQLGHGPGYSRRDHQPRQMDDPALERLVRRNAGAWKADQFRARPSNGDDLKPTTSVRTGRVQIQNDVIGFDPEQVTAAQIVGNSENVDMPRLDLQHPVAVIKQSGMTRVEQHPLARATHGRVLRGVVAGRIVTHSVITSFA